VLYSDLTNSELVEKYNLLAKKVGKPILKNWKGKKSILVDRVIAIEAEGRSEQHTKMFNAAEKRMKKTAGKKKANKKTTFKSFRAPGMPKDSIRQEAVRLLTVVDYYEDRTQKPSDENRVSANSEVARSVGLSYEQIVEEIKKTYSDAQTSSACLRWYSVKMRMGEFGYAGFKLPQRRPRSSK
jgi:hypothetical protein